MLPFPSPKVGNSHDHNWGFLVIVDTTGLRSHEARALPVDPFDRGRSDNHGGSVYLRVCGKGNKLRSVPLYSDAADALERWRELRGEIVELAGDPWAAKVTGGP